MSHMDDQIPHYNNLSDTGVNGIPFFGNTNGDFSRISNTVERWRSDNNSISSALHQNQSSVGTGTSLLNGIQHTSVTESTSPLVDQQRAFPCILCTHKPYLGVTRLQTHLRDKHLITLAERSLDGSSALQSEIKFWGCGICVTGAQFPSLEHLLNHITAAHRTNNGAFCHWDTSKVMHNLLHRGDLSDAYRGRLYTHSGITRRPIWQISAAAMTILRKLQGGLGGDPGSLVSEAWNSATGSCSISENPSQAEERIDHSVDGADGPFAHRYY